MAYNYIQDDNKDTGRQQTAAPRTSDITGGVKQSETVTAQQQTGTQPADALAASTLTESQLNEGAHRVDRSMRQLGRIQKTAALNYSKIEPQQPQRYSSYEEMFRAMNPDEPEPPEMARRRQRKERTQRIISAVGDGLRAISDMYFAYKGAKVQRDPKNDLSAQTAARLDRLKAEREKNSQAWQTGLQKAKALDNERMYKDQTLYETMRRNKALEEQNRQKEEALEAYRRERLYVDKEKQKDKKELDSKTLNHKIETDDKRTAIMQQNADNKTKRTQTSSGKGGGKGGKAASASKEKDNLKSQLLALKDKYPDAYNKAFRQARKVKKNPFDDTALLRDMISKINASAKKKKK